MTRTTTRRAPARKAAKGPGVASRVTVGDTATTADHYVAGSPTCVEPRVSTEPPAPTPSPEPTEEPTEEPTPEPSEEPEPTEEPWPTEEPTEEPTEPEPTEPEPTEPEPTPEP